MHPRSSLHHENEPSHAGEKPTKVLPLAWRKQEDWLS